MIKTMLLTAQLALSPIVGTNGLQPKLANTDPYKETSMTISYNGMDYTRMLYPQEANTYFQVNGTNLRGSIYFGEFIYAETNDDIIAENGFKEVTEAPLINIRLDNPSQGNYRLRPSQAFIENHMAAAFWVSDAGNNVIQKYIEVLGSQFHIWTIQEGWIWKNVDYMFGYARERWNFGNDYNPTNANTIAVNEGRIIPAVQPIVNSNTLYNTIYDFYHGTIFNGAGIAEYETQVGNNTMTMQEWLSHTATIATISLLCVAVAILVIKIFKLIAGSISDIWG